MKLKNRLVAIALIVAVSLAAGGCKSTPKLAPDRLAEMHDAAYKTCRDRIAEVKRERDEGEQELIDRMLQTKCPDEFIKDASRYDVAWAEQAVRTLNDPSCQYAFENSPLSDIRTNRASAAAQYYRLTLQAEAILLSDREAKLKRAQQKR